MEKVTLGWVVKHPDGHPAYIDTFDYTRKGSIYRFMMIKWNSYDPNVRFPTHNSWKWYYRRGYRCVKAQIREGWE